MMRKNTILLAIAALSIFTSACTEELTSSKKQIRVKVETESGATTKASDSSWSIANDIDISAGDLELTLSASASLYTEDPLAAQVETKGTIITTDNIAQQISSFDLYIPDAAKVQSVTASISGGEWAINEKNGLLPEWPEEGGLIDFYAYTDGASLKSGYPLTFSYTGKSTTASEQKDLLYTHVMEEKNDVNIHFYHALSAVRFVVGNLKSDYNVQSIKIKNVANSGQATYISNTSFNWEKLSDRTDYSQSYTANVHTKNAFFDNDEAACTFFVIPQSVDGLKFEVIIEDGVGNEYPVEASIPALEGGWKSGYFYTYSISGGEGTVDVQVDETFTGTVKSNVQAENTGKMASYVRAALVTNWYNEAGKAVKPYTGEIAYDTTNWYKGTDGYYYYKKPVPAGQKSSALISTFSPTDTSPANTGYDLHVEMQVIIQAVEYDPQAAKAAASWGAANLPSDLVKTLK